jgi:putative SOS response-associated peptidase YedK
MCGRYLFSLFQEEIAKNFNAEVHFDATPRYNISPGQDVAVLVLDGEERRVELFRWGLIPFWAKDIKIGYRLINAKSETIFEKPSFRVAAKNKRCLVLADGFYEWKKTEDEKIPMCIRLKSQKGFGFAGLWETWKSPKGEELKSCTIITTESNSLLETIHNRMPVIVEEKFQDLWINPEVSDKEELSKVLKPYPSEEMEAYSVSRLVNYPSNDRPECAEPIGDRGEAAKQYAKEHPELKDLSFAKFMEELPLKLDFITASEMWMVLNRKEKKKAKKDAK